MFTMPLVVFLGVVGHFNRVAHFQLFYRTCTVRFRPGTDVLKLKAKEH